MKRSQTKHLHCCEHSDIYKLAQVVVSIQPYALQSDISLFFLCLIWKYRSEWNSPSPVKKTIFVCSICWIFMN